MSATTPGGWGEGVVLGEVRTVPVERDVRVAEMADRRGVRRRDKSDKGVPVRYDVIDRAPTAVFGHVIALGRQAPVPEHMSRIGCGPAGGKWPRMEPLATERPVRRGVPVTVNEHDGD
ncbi:hypothetical protein [Streptomyces sp. KMM 9044]|uniref:hypothetical protein n=1 Tax=Streptomyces sp. KMM 9044 TaxID=2744474 RepID=UPI003FA6BB15